MARMNEWMMTNSLAYFLLNHRVYMFEINIYVNYTFLQKSWKIMNCWGPFHKLVIWCAGVIWWSGLLGRAGLLSRPALVCRPLLFIHSFIHSGYFYSASSSLLRGVPGCCIRVSHWSATGNKSEGLAQGPYVVARVGFEPVTLRTNLPMSYHAP